jgi:hypothetical protein
VATHGVEALQALVTQQEAQGADKAMYVCLGAVTEQAAKFARERGGVRWFNLEDLVIKIQFS